MKRWLAHLLVLLAIGMVAAHPPVDTTLLCDADVIGAVSYVGGAYHVALLAGATCDGAVTIAADPALVVTLLREADGVVVTFGEGEEAVPGRVTEVPQQALEGKLNAHANRAVAGQGRATAAAMRERHQPGRPVVPGPPVVPDPPVVPGPPVVPVPPVVPGPPIVPGPPDLPLEPEQPGRPELPVEPSLPAGGQRR